MDGVLSELFDLALSLWRILAGLPMAAGVGVAAVFCSGRALASGSGNALVEVRRKFSSISVTQLLDIMRRTGLEAESALRDDVQGILWRFGGLKAFFFIGDEGENLMFLFDGPKKFVSGDEYSRWNGAYRCSRSFPDDNGDPVLVMDLNLVGGVCEARIIDFIYSCHTIVAQWFGEVLFKE